MQEMDLDDVQDTFSGRNAPSAIPKAHLRTAALHRIRFVDFTPASVTALIGQMDRGESSSRLEDRMEMSRFTPGLEEDSIRRLERERARLSARRQDGSRGTDRDGSWSVSVGITDPEEDIC
jgi:hypothetical protein